MTIAAVLQNEQPWHVENCDVFSGCAILPDKSIHAIVSSPPYLGLRDYGIPPRTWPDGLVCCYGLEPDVASYVRHTVMLFEEFRRVLRDDGVIWWNVGDSYAASGKGGGADGSKQRTNEGALISPPRMGEVGQKLLIPHRVAIALADAGWTIRQDNVWAKKSPMPESISGWRWSRCRVKAAPSGVGHAAPGERRTNTNGFASSKWSPCPGCPKCEPNGGYVLRRGSWRATTAHEYIFQIVKSGEYFCDGDAAQEIAVGGSPGNKTHKGAAAYANGDGKMRTKVGLTDMVASENRNPRSVWHLSSESYKGAHFATFPSELARRCIVASCSPGGCCPNCGSQYAPRVAKERVPTRPGVDTKCYATGAFHPDSPYRDHAEIGNRDPQRHIAVSRVEGYYPTCQCAPGHAKPVPAVVLEPFCGSGTTLQVARHYGHRAIGFEVNPAYIALAKERIVKVPRCFKPKAAGKKARPAMKEQGELFQ